MALADHKPKFETETEDTTATLAETTTMPDTPVQEAAANLPATANTTAVAAPRPAMKFQMALAEQMNAFPTEAVAALSMSVPRIKAEQGACYIADKSLGDKIRMTLESWNKRWLISAGLDSKDPGYQESVEFLATSYDGVTVDGKNQTVDEYVAFLKTRGYPKAGASPYADLWGFVTWTAKDGEVAPEEQTLHLLQASKTSLGNFTAFCTTQGLLRSKGLSVDLSEIEVHAMARSNGSNKFTNFNFVAARK